MKHILLLGLGVSLLTAIGCAAGQSAWSRDPYVPAPQTARGSQTYSPKTVVSPYENSGGGQSSASSGGSGSTNGGSGSR